MAKTVETLSTVNSCLRTILTMVIFGGMGVGGWFGYAHFNRHQIAIEQIQVKDQQLEEFRSKIDDQSESIDRLGSELREKDHLIQEKDNQIVVLRQEKETLETKMQLLKVDSRVAEISVLEQKEDEATGELKTRITFVELDDRGHAISDSKEIQIEGDTLYIDYWVVKFKDDYVEQADLLRGTSICLLQRLFGNSQSPDEGVTLDEVGSRPQVYARGGKETDFEKQIWSQFWELAADPAKTDQYAIRAAHGLAPYTKLVPGKRFRITLRASDGLTISPSD